MRARPANFLLCWNKRNEPDDCSSKGLPCEWSVLKVPIIIIIVTTNVALEAHYVPTLS